MIKSDKATLSSKLLAAKKAVPSEAAGAGPSLRVIRSSEEDAAAAPVEVPELRQDLMFSKGAASAAGFRPSYWSYERDADAAVPAPEQEEFEAAAAAPEAGRERAPVPAAAATTKRRIQWAVIGFGVVALLASTTSLLNLGSRPAAVEPAPLLAAVAPRIAAAAAVARPQPPAAARAQPAPIPKPEIATALPGASGPARAEVDELVVRGITALEMGDVAAARLYLERAATASDARAALLLGQTFDPAFLKRIGAFGVRGDPAAAALWYRKARALGEPTAESHLDSLDTK